MHVVARAQATVGVDHELGHDEQRNSLHPLGRVRQAGEHEVDDVVGEVVLAVGDEDLLAEDLVGAVTLRLGLGAHRGEVGTGVRLGEVHRAGPLAGDHLGQVEVLLLVGAAQHQGLDGAAGQHRAQREGHVGRLPHFHDRGGEQLGKALAAVFRIARQRGPARLGELRVGVLPARRGGDLAIVPLGAFLVAGPVQRGEHAAGELVGFFQDRVHEVGRDLLVAGQLHDFVETGELTHHELHVADGGVVLTHCWRSGKG